MSKIAKSFVELIGKTPLLAATRFGDSVGAEANILTKLEYFNPGGSVKDRIAAAIIQSAISSGELQPGGTIVEATSGNTGIGLAMVCAYKGYRLIITMPSTMSKERIDLMKAYGAEVILTDGKKGMTGAIDKANELHASIADSIVAGQFENSANPLAHYKTTGPEIYKDSEGKVDILVAGIGTGGTISGVGKYLKEQNENIEVVGVEPFDSPMLTKGTSGPHKLQGIGAGFIPNTLDTHIYDRVITVKSEEAYDTLKNLAKLEGIFAGVSSGAALYAASLLAKEEENRGKNIVVILPDGGNRYLSLNLFD